MGVCGRSVLIRVGAVALQLIIFAMMYADLRRRTAANAVARQANADDALIVTERLEKVMIEEHMKLVKSLERDQSVKIEKMEERQAVKLAKLAAQQKLRSSNSALESMRARNGSSSSSSAASTGGLSGAEHRIAHLKQRIASIPSETTAGS